MINLTFQYPQGESSMCLPGLSLCRSYADVPSVVASEMGGVVVCNSPIELVAVDHLLGKVEVLEESYPNSIRADSKRKRNRH